MPTTADTPKCYAEVGGKRILDWIVDAYQQNGINEIVFISGYQIEKVQKDYPQFEFRHNTEWPHNNILASLFYADDLMDKPFLCSYADILFTPQIVTGLVESGEDIALSVDTNWLSRYEQRTEHPTDDAEKVTVSNGLVTRVHREIPEDEAHGEYTGVAKFSNTGATSLRDHYYSCRERYAGQPFREAKVFEKSYLIHLFQDMIEVGHRVAHIDSHGGYIEVDTQQDFEYARRCWA